MGFRLDRVYVLEFEGAMEGAWVKIRSTPIGVTMKLRNGASKDTEELIGLLAEYVTDWNFEDEKGEKVAITVPAIMAELEQPVIIKLITEWYKAAVGVTAPLDPPGTEGDLDETDIPMEISTP